MTTTAPLSTRHKTMVVRSMVVHLADERSMHEGWKAGISFFENSSPLPLWERVGYLRNAQKLG
jgi:hypothetical protein